MTRAIVGMSLPKEQSVSTTAVVILKGGAGSGFYGHKGRPGEIGGSLPKGSNNQNSVTDVLWLEGDFTEEEKMLAVESFDKSAEEQQAVLGYDPRKFIQRYFIGKDKEFADEYKMHFRTMRGADKCSGFYIDHPLSKPGWICTKFPAFEETVTHEFAHALMSAAWNVSVSTGTGTMKLPMLWYKAYKTRGFDKETAYAKTNAAEGFAESYMSYIKTGGLSNDPKRSKTYAVIKEILDGIKDL
jgi:hypothetical protein